VAGIFGHWLYLISKLCYVLFMFFGENANVPFVFSFLPEGFHPVNIKIGLVSYLPSRAIMGLLSYVYT
jgi:hypothetical protein